MSTRLIVFAKAPVAGLAKTRLIPALGAAGAAALAERMLAHAVDAAVSAGFGHVELCATPDTRHPALQRWAGSTAWRSATRAKATWAHACTARWRARCAQHRRALLIGSDAPALDAAMLAQAAAALADARRGVRAGAGRRLCAGGAAPAGAAAVRRHRLEHARR